MEGFLKGRQRDLYGVALVAAGAGTLCLGVGWCGLLGHFLGAV